MTIFTNWLEEELKNRGWSYSELARRASTHRTTVSAVMTGRNKITWEFCANVAHALGMSPIELFKKADLIATHDADDKIEEVVEIMSQLNDTDRQDILDFAKFRQQKASNNR